MVTKETADNKRAIHFPKECFKCGKKDHLAKHCKARTVICFKWNGEDYNAPECQPKRNIKSEGVNSCTQEYYDQRIKEIMLNKYNRIFKDIKINGVTK